MRWCLGYNKDKRGKTQESKHWFTKKSKYGAQGTTGHDKIENDSSQVSGGFGIHHKDELSYSAVLASVQNQGNWDMTMTNVRMNKREQALVYREQTRGTGRNRSQQGRAGDTRRTL